MTVKYLCCASVAVKTARFLWSTSVVVMMVRILSSSSSVIYMYCNGVQNLWCTCTSVFVVTMKIKCRPMCCLFLFVITVQFLCSTSAVVVTIHFKYFASVVVVKYSFCVVLVQWIRGCLLTFGVAVVQRCVSLGRLVIVHGVHVIIGSLKKSYKDWTTIQSTTIYQLHITYQTLCNTIYIQNVTFFNLCYMYLMVNYMFFKIQYWTVFILINCRRYNKTNSKNKNPLRLTFL